jgi:hypothetical protein
MKVVFPQTPENIESLLPNQIFVFGSNLKGAHGAGAARLAEEKFGAVFGQGVGLQGNSYALPTKDYNLSTLHLSEIQPYVDELWQFAKNNQTLQFLITKVGCGLAGYSVEDVAPLFYKFIALDNITLPQEFTDIVAPYGVIDGFKAMNTFGDGRLNCRGFEFKVGEVYTQSGTIVACANGFHYCEKIIDTLNYYSRENNVVYTKVRGWGSIDTEGDKVAVQHLFVGFLYNHSHDDFNSGNRNSGNWNSGDGNSGNWNSSDWNSGNRNSGNWNSGDGNSGNRNSGDGNSGDGNSGDRNSGNWNSDDFNSGNRNSGNWNSGNRNSGNWNSGDGNSGNWNSGDGRNRFLCSLKTPTYFFNKVSDKKQSDVYFPNWLYFDLIVWKSSNNMTIEEKEAYPLHEVCGGWLFNKDYKEAAQEAYTNATKSEQDAIEDIPNYDADVLYELFGIDRRQK